MGYGHQDDDDLKKLFLTTLTLFTICIADLRLAWAQNVSGNISRVGDTTHLEFKGRKDWLYESPAKLKNQISIILPAFNDETVTQLEAWTCPYIKNIKVNKSAPDGRYEITLTLNSEEVESFDYLTDDPSNLIFDFYKQTPKLKGVEAVAAMTTESLPEKQVAQSKNKKKKILAKGVENSDYKKKDRAPAGDELLQVDKMPGAYIEKENSEPTVDISLQRGVYDGGDQNYDRFRIKEYQINENSIISSQQNIYLKFPVLQQKLNRFNELMSTPPLYEIKPENADENKEVRFMQALFEKNKWGSFFETLKFFEAKHPNSQYDEIIKNMTAEAHIKLYERDRDQKDLEKFRSIYQYLIETYPNSPLTERNMMLLAYSSLEHGDGGETIRHMQNYLDKYPKSAERDRARLAMAEAYQLLKKPKDALDLYAAIIKDADEKNYSVEALYRQGDVLISEDKLDMTIASYNEAQKKFPDFKKIFPNAQFNRSEALFWQHQHKESLESYIEFLRLFPNHKFGGFALTRIGELLEIMGAPQQQVVGAFIEGYFRYPDSQGSEVARIRMLSQGLKSMPEREKKRAIDEINEITKKSTLPRIQEFATLLKAEGLSKRKEFSESLTLLLSYYQEHPTNSDVKIFKVRILRNISDILKDQLAHKKHIDALNTYGKYSSTWLKNANRIDTKFFQAEAFELADVISEAKKLYLKILTDLQALAGTKEEKERKVLENLPSISQLNLRLAALALSEKRYRDSYKYIKAINGKMSDVEEIEKVEMSAEVTEQMGDNGLAVDHLQKIIALYSNQPELLIKSKLKLIQLLSKENKLIDADKQIASIEELKNKTQFIKDEDWAKTLELKGDILLKTGQKLAAVQTYTQLLETYEVKYPLSGVRYKAGQVLFDQGDLKGAEKLWSGFDSKMGQFYKKLAQEKLSQAEWQDSYRKYIDRIPAAENLK